MKRNKKNKKKAAAAAQAPPSAAAAAAAPGAPAIETGKKKDQQPGKLEAKAQTKAPTVAAAANGTNGAVQKEANNIVGAKAAATPEPAEPDAVELPLPLQTNMGILSDEERQLAMLLVEAGQGHLFDRWSNSGSVDDDRKHDFFMQVKRLHETYPAPGGLATYLSRARSLLAAAKAGVNPLDGWSPSVPTGERLEPGTPSFEELEAAGKPELGHTGFVLVAGGLGERLGYSGIKLELPIDLATEMPYLGLYIRQILALQGRYGGVRSLPLAIMVSEDTHRGTLQLLEKHDHFGMSPDDITLMKQEKVAAIEDADGHIAMDPADPYRILTKPHGHGDVHSLLHRTGVAAKWLAMGHKWVVFMQDTNGLALHTLPAALGVSKKLGLEVNSMAIPRKAKQAIGGITKLTHADGRSMTINVEYNQLDPMLRATGDGSGDVNDPATGYSPYPGNINQLLFSLGPYVDVLGRTGGVLGEFVNPKYKDASRTTFKSPTRLECMMQDYPMALGPEARVGFTSFEPWACFSPVKNNLADAAKAQAGGTPAAGAATGEADQYNFWATLMRTLGCNVAASEAKPWGALAAAGNEAAGAQSGVTAALGPIIVLDPSVAVSCGEVEGVFAKPGSVTMTPNSALLVRGGDVTIEKLDLDGTLVIEVEDGASLLISNLTVRNDGWQFRPLSEGEMASPQTLETLRMRGYRLDKWQQRLISVAASEGRRVVDEAPPKDGSNCFLGFLQICGRGGRGNSRS